jgi:hypothetical protein
MRGLHAFGLIAVCAIACLLLRSTAPVSEHAGNWETLTGLKAVIDPGALWVPHEYSRQQQVYLDLAGNLEPLDKPDTSTHCSRDQKGQLSCWYSDGCNSCQIDPTTGRSISCTAVYCAPAPWVPPCDPKPGEECTAPRLTR